MTLLSGLIVGPAVLVKKANDDGRRVVEPYVRLYLVEGDKLIDSFSSSLGSAGGGALYSLCNVLFSVEYKTLFTSPCSSTYPYVPCLTFPCKSRVSILNVPSSASKPIV